MRGGVLPPNGGGSSPDAAPSGSRRLYHSSEPALDALRPSPALRPAQGLLERRISLAHLLQAEQLHVAAALGLGADQLVHLAVVARVQQTHLRRNGVNGTVGADRR